MIKGKEKKMNRYRKLLRNTGLISLGTFGSKLLPFLLMRLYTAVLSDGDYNAADIVSQTAKLLIPIAAIGLTEGLFRLAMDCDDLQKKQVFTAGFLIFGGGYVLLLPPMLAAFFILRATGNFFSEYMWLVGLYVMTACLHSLVTQFIRTKDHFAFFSLQGVINTVLVALLNIFFYAIGHFGVNEYVLSVCIADFVTFLIIVLKERLWRDLVNPRTIGANIYKMMIRYAAPLIPMAVSWWITAVSDRYMVRAFVDDVNVSDRYSAAYKIPTLVTLLCTVFSQSWNYSSVAEHDEKERSKFFSNVFAFYFSLLFLMASLIIAFSRLLTSLTMDPAYFDAWSYIPLLAGATAFSALSTFIGSAYTVRMKSSYSMWTSLVGAGMNILLNLLLIPKSLFGVQLAGLGAMGAAIATIISYFSVFLIRALTARHYVKFDLRPVLLSLNCLLLVGQIVTMTFFDVMPTALAIALQVFFVLALLALDGNILYYRIYSMLAERGIIKAKKKTETEDRKNQGAEKAPDNDHPDE